MAEPTTSTSVGLLGLIVTLAGPLMGPYVYVLFGATLGAATALTRHEPATAWHGLAFLVRIWGLALLFTGAGVYLLGRVMPAVPIEYLMGGVAYAIGWRWDWIAARIWPAVMRRVGIADPAPPATPPDTDRSPKP